MGAGVGGSGVSYDAYLVADLGGPEPVSVGGLNENYTYNTGPMFEEAVGVSLGSLSGKRAGEAAEVLWRAVHIMDREPSRFRAMNPENGWGDADGWREFLRRIAEACDAAPDAELVVG